MKFLSCLVLSCLVLFANVMSCVLLDSSCGHLYVDCAERDALRGFGGNRGFPTRGGR